MSEHTFPPFHPSRDKPSPVDRERALKEIIRDLAASIRYRRNIDDYEASSIKEIRAMVAREDAALVRAEEALR